MAESNKENPSQQVLRYSRKGASRATVRRHYLRWRQEQNPPLPVRCDNPECFFHTNPLIWNGKPFKPILDHRDGNNTDNRPSMLRLLCPNCDSQPSTRGGANKGHVEKWDKGFSKISNGLRDYTLFPDESFTVPAKATSDIIPGGGPADNSEAAVHRRIKAFDLRDVSFDNNVIVAGGEIRIASMPREGTHPT